MKLDFCARILLGSQIVTQADLDLQLGRWRTPNGDRYHPQAVLGCERKASDYTLLMAILYGYTPLVVEGDNGSECLVLRAHLKRFTYKVGNSEEKFFAYSLRLVPSRGRVKSVRRDPIEHAGICFDLVTTHACVVANAGNGYVRLELHREPVTGNLPELGPPDDWCPHVATLVS
ncbi:hypothetical protein KW786_01270 [Candidatus Parcubacteria bacterium]|nr:hypothetical protein [Candidatus Parcubacteria bacterium]